MPKLRGLNNINPKIGPQSFHLRTNVIPAAMLDIRMPRCLLPKEKLPVSVMPAKEMKSGKKAGQNT